MLLKLNDTGPAVAALIDDLRKLGFALPAGSTYDSTVKKSVEAFQASNVDASGLPLEIDGKVGQLTRWALDAQLNNLAPVANQFGLPAGAAGGSNAGKAALAVAIQEMQAGHGEEGGDNRGQYVRTYLNGQAPEGASWCAGFVSYCFRQALGQNAVFGYIVGAQALHNKMKSLGHAYSASIANPPMPGDIIAWRRVDPSDPVSTAWQGHIGIVHSFADGVLWTIEGNRGPYPSKVQTFRYPWTSLVVSATNDQFKGLYGLSRHP